MCLGVAIRMRQERVWLDVAGSRCSSSLITCHALRHTGKGTRNGMMGRGKGREGRGQVMVMVMVMDDDSDDDC